MVTRLFLVYLAAELAVLVALVSTIGFGWTVLLLLATFVVGLVLAGVQARRQLSRLLSGVRARPGTVTDSALVALGTVLVVVPGLVTSAAGLLLLLPATRAAVRPVLTAVAVGAAGRRAPLITVATAGARRYATRRDGATGADVIDGEVIDITDVSDAEPPALPANPA